MGTFRKLGTAVRPLIPSGILVTTSCVVVDPAAAVTGTLSKFTMLLAGVGSKPVPVIVAPLPTVPCDGLKLCTTGNGVASGGRIVTFDFVVPLTAVLTTTSTLNVC